MKKIIPTVVLGAMLVSPAFALASSVTLSPTTINTTAGKTFTVTVSANPSSGKAYTVRANISFDSAKLSFVSFAFAPKWMSLPQAGYDVEDNTNGILVKTGGYPGGITSAATLGTATFRAKQSGSATIAVTNESLILDADNQNTVSGGQGTAQITIIAAPTTSVETPTVQSGEVASSSSESSVATGTAEQTQQVASVALSPLDRLLTLGTGSAAVASLVTIVVLLIAFVGWRYWRSRSY